MIDLKQFRRVNDLGQSELAAFLGVTVPSISAYETGRSKLSKENEQKLLNNNRGWVVPEVGTATVFAPATTENWLEVVNGLSARLDEQNQQIGRLLTIVERLTTEKK